MHNGYPREADCWDEVFRDTAEVQPDPWGTTWGNQVGVWSCALAIEGVSGSPLAEAANCSGSDRRQETGLVGWVEEASPLSTGWCPQQVPSLLGNTAFCRHWRLNREDSRAPGRRGPFRLPHLLLELLREGDHPKPPHLHPYPHEYW